MSRRAFVGCALVLAAGAARAEVPVEVVERGEVRLVLDGLVREWGTEFAEVSSRADVVSGVERWSGPDDARLRFALARDADALWVAAEVTDDRLVRSRARREGDDALVITLAAESGGATAVREIALFPGVPGEFAGSVRWSTGGRDEVAGARVVEAPAPRGILLEARIPWSAMPEVRAGFDTLRARVAWRDGDVDGRGAPESILATGPGSARAPGELPRAVNARAPAPRVDPIARFRADRGLGDLAPRFERPADLGGDAQPERVAVFPGYVVACGPAINGYVFVELPTRAAEDLLDLQVRDATGDGKSDLLLRQRVVNGSVVREVLSVYALDASGALARVFAQELSRVEGSARLSDAVTWSAGGRLRVAFERNEGWDRARWAEVSDSGVEPALTPWGAHRARTWGWRPDSRSFVVERAEPNPEAAPPPSAPQAAPPGGLDALPPDLQGVLALFRQRENLPADARPSHRAAGDVVEDDAPEQLMVFERTLVVVGTRFLGGRSYYAMGLPIVAGDSVLSLDVADLTGDGKGEAVVRVRRNVTTQVRGAQVPSQREMVFAYTLDPARRGRVFAAEVARRVGDDEIVNEVRLPRRGSTEVVIEAGRARGWTEASYPFRDAAQTQYFPLLLPWDGASRRVSYRWNGSAFSRSP